MGMGHPRFHELFSAARDGDAGRLLEIATADPETLDLADSNVNTPLLLVLEQGNLALAEELITRGANLFAVNHSDRWPMKLIVRRKDALKAVDRKRLVEVAITAGACDQELFQAVWRRDRAAAAAVLAENPSQVSVPFATVGGDKGFYNLTRYCGLTPLHYAVLAGDTLMARLLLEAGADVDAVPYGYDQDAYHTPMMMVPGGGRKLAELLMEFGANPRHSTTYLSSASRAVRKVVLEHGAAGPPLMTALYQRDFEKAIEIARDDPTVINDRLPGSSSGTPLHSAAQVGCLKVIDLLIGHGMDVDTPGEDGDSALVLAPEMYCSFDVFRSLVDHGANIHVDDDKPLYYAVWQHAFGHWDYERVIRFLVQRGSKPRGLHFCAQAGNVRAAKLLVELGADVNDTGDDDWPGRGKGHTPLDYSAGIASEQPHPKLSAFLREHGAVHRSELSTLGKSAVDDAEGKR